MSLSGVVESELDEIAGRLNAEHARLVDVTVRLLADRTLWADWECRSLEAFISWRAGASHALASKVVSVARRVDDLPLCIAAFREGKLSLDQIGPIARKVPWFADSEICRQAQLMTVDQIARTVSTYPFPTDIAKPDGTVDGLHLTTGQTEAQGEPDTDSEPEVASESAPIAEQEVALESAPIAEQAAQPDMVWLRYDDVGRFRLFADVDAATGSIIENALTEARDSLFHQGNHTVDWAEAFTEVAQRSLDTVTTPQRRTRFHTHVHVDTSRVATDARGCGTDQHVADYMTCDGLRTEVFEVSGTPISVGRTQRIVPERTRRTIVHRDGGCRVPGCADHRWLDVHHIVHWAKDGATDTNNLIALCSKHHRAHHQGRLGITGDADDPNGVVFTNRHGLAIRASGSKPTPPGERSATEPTPQYTPALRERLNTWAQHFNLPEGHRLRWSPSSPAS